MEQEPEVKKVSAKQELTHNSAVPRKDIRC